MQPVSEQVHVAPSAQWIRQSPPAHSPMVQVSPGLQSIWQKPPTQLSMIWIDGSGPDPTTAVVGRIAQPAPVHTPM
jgi:hypothetical protein